MAEFQKKVIPRCGKNNTFVRSYVTNCTYLIDYQQNIIPKQTLKPATIPNNVEISRESSLILESLYDISSRLSKLEKQEILPTFNDRQKKYAINRFKIDIGEHIFDGSGKLLGQLVDVDNDGIYIKDNEKTFKIMKSEPRYSQIDNVPF